MPLVAIPGFVGPSNVLRSVNADVERTINLYPENTEPGLGKVPAYLVGTPGLTPWLILNDNPVRGLFSQDDLSVAVGGSSFYAVTNVGPTATFYGSVATNPDDPGEPASFASNGTAGNQVLITSGGSGYVFDSFANTLTLIADPDFATYAEMCAFMDGYGLSMKKNSRFFQWSALENMTDWDGLDVAERSIGSDNIVAMVRNHRELWLFGSQTSEVWYDQGDPLSPFAPIQGVFIEQGCSAPFSVQRLDNTLLWVGKNVDGAGVVWRANGYTPQRISTHAVERALEQTGFEDNDNGLTLIRSWGYQEDGHLFYGLVLPDVALSRDKERTTWVYDVATGSWCERATWDPAHGMWLPHVVNNHMFAFNRHLVGDRFSGAIYTQSLSLFTEQLVSP